MHCVCPGPVSSCVSMAFCSVVSHWCKWCMLPCSQRAAMILVPTYEEQTISWNNRGNNPEEWSPCGRTSFRTWSLYWHILVHDFTMEAAVEQRWSVTVSNLQAWTYTILDCQLFFFCFFFFLFSFGFCGLSVSNGGLTESTASVHYLHRVLD